MNQLTRLVDDEDVDGVLELVSLSQIARAWLTAVMADDADEDQWWPVELWYSESWWSREDLVRDGLLALLDQAVDEDELGIIAAGPLEVFVNDDPSRIHWIERIALKHAPLRRALRRVWLDDVSLESRSRIEKVLEAFDDPSG